MTTKELDRRFRKVGRIKRSWGTDHKPTIRAMEQMMDGLFARGRLDILTAIQKKQYTPLQVYDAWRVNDLERLPTAATLAPLKESMEKWIAKKECSTAHRLSLSQSLRHLRAAAGASNSTATVADIPRLLATARERMQGKHPRSFNLARAAAQAFAKTTVGRNSKLWSDISQVEVLRVTPQRRKHPLTPRELTTLAEKMTLGASWAAYAMAWTGMGPSEYWGSWQQYPDRIHIAGTKRAGRVRDVPRIYNISPPIVSYVTFRKALTKASGGTVTPYDLRRSYANLMESAGIPRTRRRAYMGHGAKDVTDLYEAHEVRAYLLQDGEKLRSAVGATANATLALVRA